uniref:Secreted protein n=1 Tax=Anguilla anguilla TaxID=7936 RepID=A0A0E9QTR0_ANGAN
MIRRPACHSVLASLSSAACLHTGCCFPLEPAASRPAAQRSLSGSQPAPPYHCNRANSTRPGRPEQSKEGLVCSLHDNTSTSINVHQ